MDRIIDSQPPRQPGRNDANTRGTERGTTLMGIAAIIQALVAVVNARLVWIPGMIVFASLLVLAGFFKHDNLEVFTSSSLEWLGKVLYWSLVGVATIGGLVFIWAVIALVKNIYKMVNTMQMDEINKQKAREQVRQLQLKNRQLETAIAVQGDALGLAYQIFRDGTVPGKMDINKMVFEFHGLPQQVQQQDGQKQIASGGHDPYPLNMRYEDIRGRVPTGHILVGIAPGGEIDTAECAVGALVWIVGNSGSGKTNTTVIRVEERHANGNKFYGIDPHFFKDDSLTNAIAPYTDSFLLPMARDTKQGMAVLNAFLGEFDGRKGGKIPKPWDRRTILIDEVGALADAIEEEEEELLRLLKRVARVCGQEARNFEMGGIFISQQATGLAWLRKTATMVIVHQLLMKSERELACNEDKAVVQDMDKWPVGRTYIFGVGFGQAGARTRQQPSYKRSSATPGGRDTGATSEADTGNPYTPFSDQSDGFQELSELSLPSQNTAFPGQSQRTTGNLENDVKALEKVNESIPQFSEEEERQVLQIARTQIATYGKVIRSKVPEAMNPKRNNAFYPVVKYICDREGW